MIKLRLADLRLGKVRSRNPVVPIDAKLDIDKLVARANVRLVLDPIVHPILPKERAVLLRDAVVHVVDGREVVDVDGGLQIGLCNVLVLIVVHDVRQDEAEDRNQRN